MGLGERIQQARKELGWRQEDLATAIGVSVNSVSAWEQNISVPHVRNLRALAEAMGRPIAWFRSDVIAPQHLPPEQMLDWFLRMAEALRQSGVELPDTHGDIATNQRHTGVHEMLNLHREGRLEQITGIRLTGAELSRLERLQYSGAPINTLWKAVEEVNRWRTWELQDRQRSS